MPARVATQVRCHCGRNGVVRLWSARSSFARCGRAQFLSERRFGGQYHGIGALGARPAYGSKRWAKRDRAVKKDLPFVVGSRPLVSIVDDDESVREALPDLLNEFGFDARAYSSAEEFLSSVLLDQTRCLILDVAMDGMSGPHLYDELIRRGIVIPAVFITANTDDSLRSRLLARGAVACLFKPVSDEALLGALRTALSAIGATPAAT